MQINTAYGPNFKYMSGWEYMCIDVANYYGLDKKLFEERIKWVYDNIKDLESKVQDDYVGQRQSQQRGNECL